MFAELLCYEICSVAGFLTSRLTSTTQRQFIPVAKRGFAGNSHASLGKALCRNKSWLYAYLFYTIWCIGTFKFHTKRQEKGKEVMYLCAQCPIKSSKSYLVAHRHVQIIGTEKKKNTQNISVMVHA